jgi:hypothetical protein
MNDRLSFRRPGIMTVTAEWRNELLLVRRSMTLGWDDWPCSNRSQCIISADCPT